jgi:murein DD-endopeptidase MepM/ murein hydrolase activator NlpD
MLVKEPWTLGHVLALGRRNALKFISLAIVMVLFFGSVSIFNLHIGAEVIVNGKSVGLVENRADFKAILERTGEIVNQAAAGQTVAPLKVSYVPRIVAEKEVTPEFSLEQSVLANYDMLIEAYALYVDKEFISSALIEDDMFDALNIVKSEYGLDGDPTTADFANDVVVRKEFVPMVSLMSKEAVALTLKSDKAKTDVYTVEEGDTIEVIAAQYGVTVDSLYAENEYLEVGGLYAGETTLNVTYQAPVALVKCEYTETYNEKIPHTIITEEDSTLYSGNSKTTKRGGDGEREVIATVARVNGQEVSRNVVSETILKEAEDEIVAIGTKTSNGYVNVIVGAGSGDLMKPVYGTVSSRFGSRWGSQHTGIDFACPIGTSVCAADNGTVTFVGWEGGYGMLVKVDHGNGIVTMYAHNSAYSVSVGDYVTKGQEVAKSGNTGNSTGPHCHFEVRVNGTPVNPEYYL